MSQQSSIGRESGADAQVLASLTSESLVEAVEADAQLLAAHVSDFEQRYQRFAAVTEVLEVGRPILHTRAPAVPVGLFALGEKLVAAFDVPTGENPEVADLLRVYVREGQHLRPAPNPLAHHKGLARWMADLYLSHRGRVRFHDVQEQDGRVFLRFMVRHGSDSSPRAHVLGLDFSKSLDEPTLLRQPLLPELPTADALGIPELDRADWIPGKPTSALYYHTRVGPLYAFVERGSLKLRDKVDVPRGPADLVLEGAADQEQGVKPFRTEALQPREAGDSGEVLVRVQGSESFPTFLVHYRAHPRAFQRVDISHLPILRLPEDLGHISAMFLWAANALVYLGGLPGEPYRVRVPAAGPDRLYVFQRPSGQLTLHHFDSDRRRVLHSFFDVVAYSILPDGLLCYIEGPPDQPPRPALEHTIRCLLTPFKVATGWSVEEQRHLRSFDPAQVLMLCTSLHGVRSACDRREFHAARATLDRVLVDHPFVERLPQVRDGIQRLRASVTRCLEVEQELAEIHQRRRQTLKELQADLRAALPRIVQRSNQGFSHTLEALRDGRKWLGRLEQLAAERYLPPDVLAGHTDLRRQLEDALRAISTQAARQVEQQIREVVARTRAVQARLEADENADPASDPSPFVDGRSIQAAEALLQADAAALGQSIEALQQLDLPPELGIRLAREATACVVDCEQVEGVLRLHRRRLSEAHLAESFRAYIVQLDLRIATEPRALTQVEVLDGRLEALIAEIESRKAELADLDEAPEALEHRILNARERYEARKLELLRTRTEERSRLETRFRLRLQALQVAARGTALEATALEGFIAAHPELSHCLQAITALEALGCVGEAATLRGRLEQARRLVVAERREAALFQADGDTLLLAGIRLHRNRQAFALREVMTDTGPGLALTGTGLVLGPDRLGGLRAPEGYTGQLGETAEVSRSELLAFRLLLLLADRGSPETESQEAPPASSATAESPDPTGGSTLAPAPDGLPALEQLEALARSIALERAEENYTLGLHDRDAARLAALLWPVWSSLERLAHPTAARVAGLKALLEPTGLAMLEQARLVQGLKALRSRRGRSAGTQAAAGATAAVLRRSFPGLEPDAIGYLEEELRAWEAGTPFAPIAHPQALARARTLKRRVGAETLAGLVEGLGSRLAACEVLAEELRDSGEGETPSRASPERAAEVALCMLAPWRPVPGVDPRVRVEGLAADHPRLRGTIALDVPEWKARLERHVARDMPRCLAFRQELARAREGLEAELELDGMNARPLARFIWTRLMRRAYVPLVAGALEKQLGSLNRPGMDLMGLLLLISPPGYGKTELLKKLASLLGYAFISVSGTALGKQTVSLDPATAPDASAASALTRLQLGLELRDNVLLDIEDVQACSDALLSRLLPLCDATRQVEILRDGRPHRIDLAGRRVAIVMTLNPLHATIPQALSNRATLVNLGDVADKHAADFALSFLEVAAPLNPTLESASAHQDIETFAQALHEGRDFEQLEASLNGRYARTELRRIRAVLEHAAAVRDVLMAVNRACLRSASVQSAFRIEPPFELQGSYRDMVEITRAIAPDWDEDTRRAAILRHYEGQAGLLGEAGEYNLLALRGMLGLLDAAARDRLQQIQETWRLIQSRDKAVYILMERLSELSRAICSLPDSVHAHAEATSSRLEAALAQGIGALTSRQDARLDLLARQLAAALDAVTTAFVTGVQDGMLEAAEVQQQARSILEDATRQSGRLLAEAVRDVREGLEEASSMLEHRLIQQERTQSEARARREAEQDRLEADRAAAREARETDARHQQALDAHWQASLLRLLEVLAVRTEELKAELGRVAVAVERPRPKTDLRAVLQQVMAVLPSEGGEGHQT